MAKYFPDGISILNEHEFAPHIITHIVKTMYGTDLCAGLQNFLLYLIGPICIMVGLVRRMTAPLRYIGDELTLFGASPFSIGINTNCIYTSSFEIPCSIFIILVGLWLVLVRRCVQGRSAFQVEFVLHTEFHYFLGFEMECR